MAEENNYVLGRGKVYFDAFLPGTKTPTGERYFGNTPELSLSQDEESLDHYSSDEGVRVKDASVTLSQDTSGTLTCDNIDSDNLALWWLGDVASVTVAQAAAQSDQFVAKRGTWVQLGVSAALPQGVGSVTNVAIANGGAVAAAGNWEADLNLGRVYILPDATDIDDGDTITITYDQEAVTVEHVIAKGKSIYGALRFIATNPVGRKRDAYFPYVKLAPEGDYALKGEDWQTLSFALDILKRDDATERVYWTTRAG